MSMGSWAAPALLAGTMVLAFERAGALCLRKHVAWQNAVARTALLLLLVLPVAFALAARVPGPRWKSMQHLSQTIDRWEPEIPLPIFNQPGFASPLPTSDAHPSMVSLRKPVPTLRVSLHDSLLGVWGIGVMGSLGCLLIGLVRVGRMVRAARPLFSPESQTLLAGCARTAGVARPALQAVPDLVSPLLVGWLHPCILVPAESGAPSCEILLHELAHLRRRDLWWTTLGRIAMAMWWFHPLAWGLTRRLECSAENLCDDLVVLWTENAPGYASQLVDFARTARSRPSFALAGAAITGFHSSLGQRVARLLEPERKLRISIGGGGKVLLTTAAAAVLGMLLAAAPSQGEEVAAPEQTVGEIRFSLSDDLDGKGEVKEVPAPAEIVSISGLHLGAKYDEFQAHEAARRLLASERFEYAQVYSHSVPGAAMVVEIACTPKFAMKGAAGTSDHGGAVPSMAASVNGAPILDEDLQDLFAPRERALRSAYTGEELSTRLNDGRRQALDELIDRELLIQEFARQEYRLPENMVDDRITAIIREEFKGDYAAFIIALARQNHTEERFRQIEHDKIAVQAMRYQAVRDLIEQEKTNHSSVPTESRRRQEKAFVKELRVNADIRITSSGS